MAHAATIVASSTRLVHMVASFAQIGAFKLRARAARQCRTPLESASERGGPPRRTTAYFDELPELDEPLALEPEALLEPELSELSPPGERPVCDFAAAAFVEEVGGLPETLSFLATFFLAFFTLWCLVVVSVVVAVVSVVASATAARSLAVVLVLERACLSSFESAVVVSVERGEDELVGALDVVALRLPYVAEDELLSIFAFVPGAELLLSAYDMPCGFCEFAGTVGEASAVTDPEAAGAVYEDDIDEDVFADESAGRPLSLEVEVVLGVVIDELVVSGAFWSFLKCPIASALPAANARMEVVRKIGASLRMVGPPGIWIRKVDTVLTAPPRCACRAMRRSSHLQPAHADEFLATRA